MAARHGRIDDVAAPVAWVEAPRGWRLARRPRLLTQAVTLAIYGFHFRKVFEKQMLNQPDMKGGLLCR